MANYNSAWTGVQIDTSVSESVHSKVFNVKAMPYSAIGDGIANDTAAIQAAFNAATPGTMILFPPSNCNPHCPITRSS